MLEVFVKMKIGPVKSSLNGEFSPNQLGYFWRLIMIFWKDEVAQNDGNFLGNFLIKQIYYIFT